MNDIQLTLPVLILILGVMFGVGFTVARLGTWFRIVQIEAKFRNLAIDVYDYGCMSGKADVPVEWVCDLLRQFIRREFRTELHEID